MMISKTKATLPNTWFVSVIGRFPLNSDPGIRGRPFIICFTMTLQIVAKCTAKACVTFSFYFVRLGKHQCTLPLKTSRV